MKVLMGLGYYEVGGFNTVVNALVKHLQAYGVEVSVGARVIKVKPPKWLNLARLTPHEFVREASKYDVVHIHLSYPYLKALLKAKYGPLVVTHHGYTPWYMTPGFKNKVVHLYLRFAYKLLLPKVPYIVAVSNYVKRQLRKLYGIDARIIYNGIDLEIFKPIEVEEGSGYPVIFNATAWNKLKGVDLLLKHFSLLKEQYTEAKLIARGLPLSSHWVRRFLEKAHLRIGRDVEVLPYLPYEKLPYYYSLADFYLLTSRWESFGLPIIEAFACGTPVVAYYNDDARIEHIKNSEAGIVYRDKESLFRAVEDILKHREVYSKRAVDYATKLDWRNIALEYLKVYSEALNDS